MFFDIKFAIESFSKIIQGISATLLIALISMLLGLIMGLLVTLCKMYKVPVLNKVATVYVSFIRGTPILVQIYIIYYSLPLLLAVINQKMEWHLSANNIPPLIFALTAFTINTAAYLSETIRSALTSVDVGQMEAAQSIGMTTIQSLRRIIIPQALVVAVPNFGNQFLSLIKETSLAFTVMVVEIMAEAKVAAASGYRYLEAYTDAALIYWGICFCFEKLFLLAEQKVKHYKNEIVL